MGENGQAAQAGIGTQVCEMGSVGGCGGGRAALSAILTLQWSYADYIGVCMYIMIMVENGSFIL